MFCVLCLFHARREMLCFMCCVLCFAFCVSTCCLKVVCLAGLFFCAKLLSSCGAFELPLTMQLCDGDSAIGIDGSFKFRGVESTPSPNKHVVSGHYKGSSAAKPKSKSGNT